MSSIHDAARAGDLIELSRLLRDNPDIIHTLDDSGWTALHQASEHGHVDCVVYLLKQGASINQQSTGHKCTALFQACAQGHTAVVAILLQKGADPTICNSYGCYPLFIACLRGHPPAVRVLLSHKQSPVPINNRDRYGRTALGCACTNGHANVVNALLVAGADPSMTCGLEDGVTALALARRQGHYECVRILEEWERLYALTKARRLYDAAHETSQRLMMRRSSGHNRHQAKFTKVQATAPDYLKERVEEGLVLPKVEITAGSNRSRSLALHVSHHVISELKGELFIELMEVMGISS